MQKYAFFKMLMLICLLLTQLGLTPKAYAFFGLFEDSAIDIVKEGTFTKKDSLNIEKNFEKYSFCKDGQWDIEDNKTTKVVTYQCTYDSAEAIKKTLAEKNMQATEVENSVLSAMQNSGFSVDFLIKFILNPDKKSFHISHMGYVYDNKELPSDSALIPALIQDILHNRPLTLSLTGSAQNNLEQSVTSLASGKYIYAEPGQEGSALIVAKGKNIHVVLSTLNTDSMHTCSFEGMCIAADTAPFGYVCQEDTARFTLIPTDEGFSIQENPTLLCGARGFMQGNYKKSGAKKEEKESPKATDTP